MNKNLFKVIKFEILKQIRKPLFWIAIFILPVIMIVFGGISILSGKMAESQSESAKESVENSFKSIAIVDQTKLIKPEILGSGINLQMFDSEEEALQEFKDSDKFQALIVYPEEITTERIKAYSKMSDNKDKTKEESMGLESLSDVILQESAKSNVDPYLASVLANKSFRHDTIIIGMDGQNYNPIKKMIVPGFFAIAFFIIFTTSSNQMLMATIEEKESRVAEMILTTITSKALIIGKIIAILVLTFIQISAMLLPILALYFIGVKCFDLPPIMSDLLSGLAFEFWPIFFGSLYFFFGLFLMTGITVLIGSMFPTAQDAAQAYTPIVFGVIIPIYFVGAIMTGAKSIIITVLSFIPFTAPITLLLRNAADGLTLPESLIGLACLTIYGLFFMFLAVKIFRQGVFSYDKRFSFRNVFSK